MTYLYPGISVQYKEIIMPYHIFFGIFNFVLAIATSVLGFGEKLIFKLYVNFSNITIYIWCTGLLLIILSFLFLSRGANYKTFPSEGLFGNYLGILCIVFGGIVVYMVTKPEYKRQPKPEDGVLLTGAAE